MMMMMMMHHLSCKRHHCERHSMHFVRYRVMRLTCDYVTVTFHSGLNNTI
jgi:hypothetical protein